MNHAVPRALATARIGTNFNRIDRVRDTEPLRTVRGSVSYVLLDIGYRIPRLRATIWLFYPLFARRFTYL